MPDHERLYKIAETLLARTASDDVEWTGYFGEKYQTESGPYRLQIESEDGDGSPPYKLSLLNASGTVLDSLSMSERPTSPELPRLLVGRTLRTLFEAARRKALGVDEAITKVERDLGIV